MRKVLQDEWGRVPDVRETKRYPSEESATLSRGQPGVADRDVTGLVRFGDNDGEALPLTRCVCGAEFDWWRVVLSIYRDDARECPHCGRRLYFRVDVKVFEVANQ